MQRKKNHSNPPGQADKSSPPPKMGRGIEGVKTSGTPRGALSRRGHSGRGQSRGTPSNRQVVAPQVICGYCSKPKPAENEC